MNIIDFVPPHLLHIRPQASQRYVRQTLEEGERLASGHCFTGLQDDDVAAKGAQATLATTNNNPLNVRYSPDNHWVGKGADNGSGFEQFDTPEHGLRVGLKLMRRHIDNGSDTLLSLMRRWAPTGDNNAPARYAQAVSRQTGIPVEAKLNADDANEMTALARAIATQEGYGRRIEDAQASVAWQALDNPAALSPGINLAHLTLAQQSSLLHLAQANNARAAAFQRAEQSRQIALESQRDAAASQASHVMTTRIAKGKIPSQHDWQHYTRTVQSTPEEGTAPVLRRAMVKTQQLLAQPPAQAQQALEEMQLALKHQGGSGMQYQVLKALQHSVDQRHTALQTNPQSVAALDAGQPLQPLDPADALAQPGVWGQTLLQRQVNAAALLKKYGPTAGKNLLTPDELHNVQDAYARMTSDQRIQLWRNTQASSSPAIEFWRAAVVVRRHGRGCHWNGCLKRPGWFVILRAAFWHRRSRGAFAFRERGRRGPVGRERRHRGYRRQWLWCRGRWGLCQLRDRVWRGGPRGPARFSGGGVVT